MFNIQLPGSKTFDSQIIMHSCTQNNIVSIAEQFQKYMPKDHRKHGYIDQGNIGKEAVKENGQTESITFRIMLIL